MTTASCKVTKVALLLFQLLGVVFCIPVNQFYPFGAGTIFDPGTSGLSGVQAGNDLFSIANINNKMEKIIRFYGEPQQNTIYVSDLRSLAI